MSTRRPASNPLVAVAYLRVSTDEQSLGLDAQRAAIEAWAVREGVTIAAWHCDLGLSGGADIAARPSLVAALADLRTHRAGLLVAAKHDRVARDILIATTIERVAASASARIVSADGVGNGTTGADKLMRTMMQGMAEFERSMIKARTKAALAAKAARGERVGSVAYGYELAADGVHLVARADEQAVISTVRALSAGGFSVRRIVAELGARNVVSRAGKPLGVTQVQRILVSAQKQAA